MNEEYIKKRSSYDVPINNNDTENIIQNKELSLEESKVRTSIKKTTNNESNEKLEVKNIINTNNVDDNNDMTRQNVNNISEHHLLKNKNLFPVDEEINLTPQYDEKALDEIGNDYIKGIQTYQDLNEKLRQESNTINQKIKDLEKAIGMIKNQQILKDDKDRAIINTKAKNINSQKSNKMMLIVGLILFGLIIGANLANLWNRMFEKKEIIKETNNYL